MNVAGHQICLAHILRELIFLTEFDKNQSWSTKVAELMRDAIHKRKTKLWTDIDRESIMKKFNNLLEISKEAFHQKTISLLKSITKFKEYVFKFLFEPDVPYDNNTSERAV